MITIAKGFPDNVIAVDCAGHVTRGDYETILIPAVEAALKGHEKLRLYYRIGPDFEAIDPAAVFEDMKVGFSHLSRWDRIAVVTDIEWIRLAIRAFAFLLPGAVRFFAIGQEDEARDWICAA